MASLGPSSVYAPCLVIATDQDATFAELYPSPVHSHNATNGTKMKRVAACASARPRPPPFPFQARTVVYTRDMSAP